MDITKSVSFPTPEQEKELAKRFPAKTKTYQVFYTVGSVQHKTSRVYKGLGSARKDAARVAINQLAGHIHIVGYDEMAHENFREVVR